MKAAARKSFIPLILCLASGAAWCSGCGWFSSGEDDLAEEVVSEPGTKVAAAGSAASATEGKQPLTLNLKVGDRFPLLKKVENQLSQPAGGAWVTSHSSLELLLSLTVEEIRPMQEVQGQQDPRAGHKRLQVRYHRVRFSQEIPGQPRLDYDSDAPRQPLPLAVQGYHGLKDNGFQFWLDADNQILEIVGFDAFLERCLKDVAPNRRQQVKTILAATSGADGIANFVDDSIGLLPTHTVRAGDTWKRTRQILQPVPMHCTTEYTLRSINPDNAEVDIHGTVAQSATYGPSDQPNRDMQISIRKGHSYGSCLIDRRTGLPTESRVQQSLEMHVHLADGNDFQQHKTTVTTLRYSPEQGVARVVGEANGTTAENRQAGPSLRQ